MSRKSREQIFQEIADKCKCPKCGCLDLEVYISCCYDPQCCGISDSVRCTKRGCYYEVEGYFDEDDADTFIQDRGLTLKTEEELGEVCSECGGSGFVGKLYPSGHTEVTCEVCYGEGRL